MEGEAPLRGRNSITAEYGAVGATPVAVEPVAVEPVAVEPAEIEPAELDAMKTVPSLRRAKARSSKTPTEEVPRIGDAPTDRAAIVTSAAPPGPPTPVEVDDGRTHPRITRTPRWSRHPASPIAYEDTLRMPLDDRGSATLDRGRAQALLEHADRDHRRREGLERLAEIVEYRELRLRALQGGRHEPTAVERYAELERALQQRPPAGDDMAAMRRYHRFVCSVPAVLVPPQDVALGSVVGPTVVEIEDVSAGGAKVTFGECSLMAGDEVSLTVELDDVDRTPPAGTSARSAARPSPRIVVLEARVVWAQPHDAALGLVFVGAPRYDHLDSAPRSPF